MKDLDNNFWRFSLAIYREAQVADQCLALQNTLGANVNALLFCAWIGTEHHLLLGDADIATLRENDAKWQEPVVRALRGVRQTLKPLAASDEAIQALRKKVLEVELSAEQIEQSQLYARRGHFTRHAQKADRAEAINGNVRNYLASLTAGSGAAPSPDTKAIINAALAYRP